jgi:hypothetical protein
LKEHPALQSLTDVFVIGKHAPNRCVVAEGDVNIRALANERDLHGVRSVPDLSLCSRRTACDRAIGRPDGPVLFAPAEW